MDCPKCGHNGLVGDECPKCGIFISKYLKQQARKAAKEEEVKKLGRLGYCPNCSSSNEGKDEVCPSCGESIPCLSDYLTTQARNKHDAEDEVEDTQKTIPAIPATLENISNNNNYSKKCPFCQEEIIASAIKCKHCHSILLLCNAEGLIIPWYRKNWFVITAWILLSPVAIAIILSGDVYYIKDGKLKTYSDDVKMLCGLIGTAYFLIALHRLHIL